METVRIIALHLAFGGIEKAIVSMANIFAERYDTEIISVYNMPDSPAFELDKRVRVRYLLDDIPNRDEWHKAVSDRNIGGMAKESLRAVKILAQKKNAVIRAIKEADGGVVITTRHEDNVLLSKYGGGNVLKIAQLHHDHRFDRQYIDGFRNSYGGIDVLCMLTPGLTDEVKEMMRGCNGHTEVVYMPNFLEHFPKDVSTDARDKTVVAVGRLNPLKRFDLLIEMFARLHEQAPEWKLRIVGEGEEREKLEALIRDLNADSYVNLTGKQDSAGVEREMRSASLFAMSSSTEGFPFVLLEAQSCGLPVVAFDVRVGPGFVVHDGEDGFLLPEGDREGFVTSVLGLTEDEELRRNMAEKAMRHAEKYSKEAVSEMWYSLIDKKLTEIDNEN